MDYRSHKLVLRLNVEVKRSERSCCLSIVAAVIIMNKLINKFIEGNNDDAVE